MSQANELSPPSSQRTTWGTVRRLAPFPARVLQTHSCGSAPYQNSSLLHVFSTLLTIGETYTVQIEFKMSAGVYSLFDAAGTQLLEQHSIGHTPCESVADGYKLGLYFGGQCPAPQAVSVCYSDPETHSKP